MYTFYIIHPNGREKLDSQNVADAMVEFQRHWTAKATWLEGKKPLVRRLMQTHTSEIHREDLEGI